MGCRIEGFGLRVYEVRGIGLLGCFRKLIGSGVAHSRNSWDSLRVCRITRSALWLMQNAVQTNCPEVLFYGMFGLCYLGASGCQLRD